MRIDSRVIWPSNQLLLKLLSRTRTCIQKLRLLMNISKGWKQKSPSCYFSYQLLPIFSLTYRSKEITLIFSLFFCSQLFFIALNTLYAHLDSTMLSVCHMYFISFSMYTIFYPLNHLKVKCRYGDILPISTLAASPKNKDVLPVTTTLSLYPRKLTLIS